MLATCTITIVPFSVFGSIVSRIRWSAMIGTYSMPCVPAISASTGPADAPWMTVIGMVVPVSPARAATWIVPAATVPGWAVTGPTVKACCARAGRAVASSSRMSMARRMT